MVEPDTFLYCPNGHERGSSRGREAKRCFKGNFFFFLNTLKKGGGGSRLWNEVGGASCGIWGSCVLNFFFFFSLFNSVAFT